MGDAGAIRLTIEFPVKQGTLRLAGITTLALALVLCAVFLQHDGKCGLSASVPAASTTGAFPRAKKHHPAISYDGENAAIPLDGQKADGAMPQGLAEVTPAEWEDPECLADHLPALLRWASSNPSACREWMHLQPMWVQQKLIPEMAGSLMSETPLESFQFLNELPASPRVDEMLRQAAMELATGDPAATVIWAKQQDDENSRELLLSAAYCVQAQTAPEAAAEAALREIHDPVRRERVIVEIAQRWVQQNPRAAAGFVGTLDGSTASDAASAVASQWVASDANACGTWILTLPPLVAKAAFRAFLDFQLLHDPEGLARMAPAVQDPELRRMLDRRLDKPAADNTPKPKPP